MYNVAIVYVFKLVPFLYTLGWLAEVLGSLTESNFLTPSLYKQFQVFRVRKVLSYLQ